jgi:hypothetical protein
MNAEEISKKIVQDLITEFKGCGKIQPETWKDYLESLITRELAQAAIQERERCIENLKVLRHTADVSRYEVLNRQEMGPSWGGGFYAAACEAVRRIEARRHTRPEEQEPKEQT